MATIALATAAAALFSAAGGAYSAYTQKKVAEDTLHEQAEAQRQAEEKQRQADMDAERQRLEGIAENQTATDYGRIWGANSANYADAAQKLSAGTGSFNTGDDETNPFYQRGLL